MMNVYHLKVTQIYQLSSLSQFMLKLLLYNWRNKIDSIAQAHMGSLLRCCLGQPEDPTLVPPDFQTLKYMASRTPGEEVYWPIRSSTTSQDLSLILPASKNTNPYLIIRYYLLYTFHIRKYASNKKHFQLLFFKLIQQCAQNGERELLSQLIRQYRSAKNDSQLNLLLVNYAFKSDFVLERLNKILLCSYDLKSLVYFIFPIHALYHGIINNFAKPDINRKDSIWIVAVLQKNQIEKLKKLQGNQNYFFFSAFMRGFTKRSHAQQAFNKMRNLSQENNKRTFLFTVNFPYDFNKLSSRQNKGFFICKDTNSDIEAKGDVIFNIMNSFKLSSKTDEYQYDIEYGQLARMCEQKDKDRFSMKDPVPVRIYQLCRGVCKFYLKSQSCLFRIISEKDKSLQVSITVMKSSADSIHQRVINDIQRQNIVNTHIENYQFDQALKNIEKSDNMLFKAKKIEILYKMSNFEEVKAELAKIKISDLNTKENLQSRLIIDLIAAKMFLNNKEYKNAKERLKPLYQTLVKEYPEDFQYIGRDVILTMIECDKRGGFAHDLEQEVKWGAGSFIGIEKYIYQHKQVSLLIL